MVHARFVCLFVCLVQGPVVRARAHGAGARRGDAARRRRRAVGRPRRRAAARGGHRPVRRRPRKGRAITASLQRLPALVILSDYSLMTTVMLR